MTLLHNQLSQAQYEANQAKQRKDFEQVRSLAKKISDLREKKRKLPENASHHFFNYLNTMETYN